MKAVEKYEYQVNVKPNDFFTVDGKVGMFVQCGQSIYAAVVFDGHMFNRIVEPINVDSHFGFSALELKDMFGSCWLDVEIISSEEFINEVNRIKKCL